jgi:hypothetical protein
MGARMNREFLKEMTDLALKYDVIIAENLCMKDYTYDPEFGYKLYWDNDSQEYVAARPDGSIMRPDK